MTKKTFKNIRNFLFLVLLFQIRFATAQTSQLFYLADTDSGLAMTSGVVNFKTHTQKELHRFDGLSYDQKWDEIAAYNKKLNTAMVVGSRTLGQPDLYSLNLITGKVTAKIQADFSEGLVYDNQRDIAYAFSHPGDNCLISSLNTNTGKTILLDSLPLSISPFNGYLKLDARRSRFFFVQWDSAQKIYSYSLESKKLIEGSFSNLWGFEYDYKLNRIYGVTPALEFGWYNADSLQKFNVINKLYSDKFNAFYGTIILDPLNRTFTLGFNKLLRVYSLETGALIDSLAMPIQLNWNLFSNTVDYVPNIISGRAYTDNNNNGKFDAGTDFPLKNVKVNSKLNNYSTYTNDSGFYTIYSELGHDSLTCTLLDYTDSIKPKYYSIDITNSKDKYPNNDFILYRSGTHPMYDVNICAWNILRKKSNFKIQITSTNTGTTQKATTITCDFPKGLNYDSSSTKPLTVSSSSIKWNTPALKPSEHWSILVNFKSDSNISGNLKIISSILTGSFTPKAKYDTLIAPVRSSYDPNEKTVFPPEGNTLPGRDLKYSIHFQNTGNDTAFKVVLMDTLSPYLDLNTFHFNASSHKAVYDIIGRTLRVTFNDILLPDSTTNQLESNGFFSYSIAPLSTAALGSDIKNTAHIYFDYNAPVATNTTSNILSVSTSISNESKKNEYGILTYPNPTSGMLHIKIPNTNNTIQVQILNAAGQLIYQTNETTNEFELSLQNQPAGLYIGRLTKPTGESVGRVLISKVE